MHTVLQALHTESEARPDVFVRVTHPARLNNSRHLFAKFLNAPPSTVVIVPNATTGVNTVLHNLEWQKGDTILYFSTTYGSCINTLLYLAETTQVILTQIPLFTRTSLSTSAILTSVRETVASQRSAGLTPRLVLLDTIVSQPGILLPFPELLSLCRELRMYSLVDAAHGIGHIPLNLTELDPDFLVTNAHKWLFVPRACAVMYVPERNQDLIRSSIPTSANFVPRNAVGGAKNPLSAAVGASAGEHDKHLADNDNTRFVKLFEYVGTLDSLPYLCVPAALEFRDKVCGGEEMIGTYCADLASRGAEKVAEMLGTEVLNNEEKTLTTGISMVNVCLPLDPAKLARLHAVHHGLGDMAITSTPASATECEVEAAQTAGALSSAAISEEKPAQAPAFAVHVANWMQAQMVKEHKTFMAIGWWDGRFWTRLSAQIYLDFEDFVWAGQVLRELCEKVDRGKFLE